MLTNVKKWQQIRVASERLSTSIQCIYYISICVENKICFFVFFNYMTGSNISDLSVPPQAYVSTSTYLSILHIHVFIHMQDSFYLDSNICIATRHPSELQFIVYIWRLEAPAAPVDITQSVDETYRSSSHFHHLYVIH